MLSTTAYDSRKTDFLAYKDTLVKEPSGDVKKEYYVGCRDKSDWVFIHEELMKDGSLEDNIPDDSCDCANDCLHSDTRGVYLLTDTEAIGLRNHAKVTYVHINAAAYPGTYMDNPDDVAGASGGKDIKIGDDKRPVQKIPKNEQLLYNYANGEILTDEFENPLVTEVDTFYLPSATASKSTSVTFDDENEEYVDTVHSYVGFETGMVALYGNLDVFINTNADDQATILKASGTSVTGIKTEVKLLDGTFVAWHDPHVTSGISSVGIGTQHYTKYTERDGSLPSHFPLVRSNTDQTPGLDAKLYVDGSISQIYTLGARSGSRLIGAKLPSSTTISGITHNSRLLLSHKANEFRFNRYTGTVKHQRDFTSAYIPSSPGADLLNRGSWQLKRMQHKVDPWQDINDNTIIEDRIMQTGDGTDVDVIVGDQDMWFGHIEFQNNLGGPTGYRGGNVLPGNGTCDLLDLVLDAPMYLDPDWFGTDNVPGNPGYHVTYAELGYPASKIITRWDGTKVPHEDWARRWWMEASARSHEADIVLLPNTASEVTIAGGFSTTFPDFGSIIISTSYTRAACNGSNSAYQTGSGFHGTPCASQAYGRQFGWAYNANKWFVSAYGAGSLGWENYFDITKIFHRYKPINPDLGTKDPTVSSNSWGHRRSTQSSGYYWHRPANTNGVAGTQYSTRPPLFNYFRDGYLSPKERGMPYIDGHAALDAGKELVDEGVIFVCAAGNHNQKLVQSDHPDYNNYIHTSDNTALSSATQSGYSSMGSHSMLKTLNRPGYPQQIGKYSDGTTNKVVYRTIAVGALDNDHHSSGKECKVIYTNMGNAVDVFAPADETLAATDNNHHAYLTSFSRYDKYYTIGGTQSALSEDCSFNGTSSACPIAAGMIAAKVQYNRNWGWSDVKAWFRESNKEQSSDDFYLGTETTSPTDNTNWGDPANLHGASPTVIWDSMSAGETWHFREPVQIRKSEQVNKTANVVWKVEEQFKETSEVSSTLLGIPRAETQLSLFSNVSSYGIDTDDFEDWSWATGNSIGAWERRRNRIYGNRYTTQVTEETQESGIRIASFPVPYSYPFGPKFDRVGLYRPTTFEQYRDFISMGNDLHRIFNGLDENHNPQSPPVTTYFDHTGATRDTSLYGDYFKESFLSRKDAKLDLTENPVDVDYVSGITSSFAAVDTWTDTWRKLNDNDLTIPNTDIKIGLREARQILVNNLGESADRETTRPGYDAGLRRVVQLQSRKVFRYQPGRISGFTFGLRASKGRTAGYTNEWGIANPTDQYVFRIRSGFLKIVRRSTISLANSVYAIPENLEETRVDAVDVAHPVDGIDPNSATGESIKFYELEIHQENFNGDRLDGNGPSGYVVNPEAVTMYKIEFGWYGAIGVRFYAYVPVGNDDARWVVLHTMVIENQLGQPCLQDSYFRFVYNINVTAPSTVTEPMFVYKYGASYYIDGGDEGTSQIYSASTPIKKITGIGTEALMGVTPKDFIFNSVGKQIKNRKLILPTRLQVSSSQLAEIKTVVCKGCPGFGHVHTPGASTGSNARTIPAEGTSGSHIMISSGYKLVTGGTGNYFTIKDIDAKVISPTISNCYIGSLADESSPGSGLYETALLKGFTDTSGLGVDNRIIADYPVWDSVLNVVGVNTNGQIHPHPIKLSPMGGTVASNFKLNGTKIICQFVNPSSRDGYGHFADFSIGLTNCVPQVSAPDILTGWKTPGGVDITDPANSGLTTSVLPSANIIEGRYTQSWASIDGEGVEQSEAWDPSNPRMAMGMDYRIDDLPSPAPGHCSRIVFEVENSFTIDDMEYLTTYPPDSTQPAGTPPHFLQVKGDIPSDILYDGGEVTIVDTNGTPTNSGKSYVGAAGSYFKYDEQTNKNVRYSWIRISGDISAQYGSTNISVAFRPLKATSGGIPTNRKIFTYNPFPLYLTCKMRDNASFNNLSIREEIGDFDRTITPKLYKPLDTSTSITLAPNSQNVVQADPDDAPTHYDEIDRLCSALIDTQNEQKLRQEASNSKVIDTVYIGAGETKSLDLTKIFGPDRAVITPDNNNTEATFFIATRVDGQNAESDIQLSLNFREQ